MLTWNLRFKLEQLLLETNAIFFIYQSPFELVQGSIAPLCLDWSDVSFHFHLGFLVSSLLFSCGFPFKIFPLCVSVILLKVGKVFDFLSQTASFSSSLIALLSSPRTQPFHPFLSAPLSLTSSLLSTNSPDSHPTCWILEASYALLSPHTALHRVSWADNSVFFPLDAAFLSFFLGSRNWYWPITTRSERIHLITHSCSCSALSPALTQKTLKAENNGKTAKELGGGTLFPKKVGWSV